jgi:hypothetical protein
MVLNQLFNDKPSLELVNKLVSKFGLKDINDNKEFTILDMDRINTLVNFKIIESDIKESYIPCKRAKYTSIFTNKSLITILRQFIKLYDHDLFSKEKFINGRKYLVYKIVSKEDKEFSKKNKKYINKKEITIVFD